MITFEKISKQYGGSVIFESTEFVFSESERIGLIGANGSGKTTLLRMITGTEEPDSGSIVMPSGMKVGYLPQEVESYDDKTPMEIVLEPYRHILDYEEQLQHLSADLSENRGTLRKIDELHTELEVHDVFSLASRAESILSGLGIPQSVWTQPVRVLSGGYKMRAVLAQLLLTAPDFLLLDEPTNHLDMDSLIWLEKYMLRLRKGMLIVSHDRDFLNRITTCIAGIENRKITVRTGNYDQFMRIAGEEAANAESRKRNLELQIAQNERFVERFKAKATKAVQAQSRMKLIDKLRSEMDTIRIPAQRRNIRFTFPVSKQSGLVPVKFCSVNAGYNNLPIISDFSININRGDKVAVIGPNGSGKSTLLKLVSGILAPLAGNIEFGLNVTVRYFGQHLLDQLNPEKSLYETVAAESVNTTKTFVGNILGAFLFSGDTVDKKTAVLSGGEKARLVLATILSSPGNLLLLDEPTNHLDIDSIAMLAEAMREFTGTVIFVSHDEYFVSKIANRIIEMRPGKVRDFPGTLHDYRYYLETLYHSAAGCGDVQGVNERSQPKESTVSSEKAERIKSREEKKRLQRAIERCERNIESEEKAVTILQTRLDDPVNASNHALLHELSKQLQSARDSIDQMLAEWGTLQSELETVYPLSASSSE